jgi:2-polyprenyl-3-methyl-5-hydroxy-6-metoxy-1,4-benzoquinol methylase
MSEPRNPRVVPSTAEAAGDELHNVPGNYFDKHGSRNPIVRHLMDRFHGGLLTAISGVPHKTLLDVGCGEGRTTAVLAEALDADVVGAELEASAVEEAVANVSAVRFVVASVYELPFRDGAFDCVVATEVLEHLDTPGGGLTELMRVARHAVVVTVPHEPWWRMANVARGRYLRDLGNTPGHVQHWSRSGFRQFLSAHADGSEVTVAGVGLWSLGVITW